MSALENHGPDPSSYRASLIKRRRPRSVAPSAPSVPASAPPPRNLELELRREQRARIEAERRAIAQVEAITASWNDELSSTVPSLASVVSRAVAAIVGNAPREDVVENALRHEVARVRGDHQPVLRVSVSDRREWIDTLIARGEQGETSFTVRRDEALSPGKCILELGARRVDLSPETQLAAFDDHVRGGIGNIEAPPPPPLPATALDPLPEATDNASEPAKAPRLVRAADRDAGATVTRPGRASPGSGGANVTITRGSSPDGSGNDRDASGKASARDVTVSRERMAVRADAPRVAEKREKPKRARSEPKARSGPQARIERASVPDWQKAPVSSRTIADPTTAVTTAGTPSFDELDLGEGAARFDAPSPGEQPLADRDARSRLAPEGIEAMASAVGALRARVSRDVSAMRALVEDADGSGKASRSEESGGDAPKPATRRSTRWASVMGRDGSVGEPPLDTEGDAKASAGIRGILAERARPMPEAGEPDAPSRASVETDGVPLSPDEPAAFDDAMPADDVLDDIAPPRESARERRRRSLNLPPWMAALSEEPSR